MTATGSPAKALDDLLLVVQQRVDGEVDADHGADFFDILPRRIRLKFAKPRILIAHHSVVAVDGLDAGQADGGALDPARESLKLMRLDIADHDAVIGSQVVAVDMHGRPARGLAQVCQDSLRRRRCDRRRDSVSSISAGKMAANSGCIAYARMRAGRDDEQAQLRRERRRGACPASSGGSRYSWGAGRVLSLMAMATVWPGARRLNLAERGCRPRHGRGRRGIVRWRLRPPLHKLDNVSRGQIRPYNSLLP